MRILAALKGMLPSRQGGSAVVRVVPSWYSGEAKAPLANFESFYKDGYSRNIIVAACIWEIASSATEPKMQLVNKNTGEELENGALHDYLMDLLENPNPEQSGEELLQELMTFQQLTGVWLLRKIRGKGGRVVRIISLDPNDMKIIQDRNGWVKAYKHRYLDRPIPAEDIIKCKLRANPNDIHWGISPLRVLGEEIDFDNLSVQYLRSYFKNNAIPAGLLKFRTVVREEDQQRIQKRWEERYGGQRGWNSVAVTDASVEFESIGSDPKSLNLRVAWDETATRICMAFQVPAILVGTQVGLQRSTYSNYYEARKSFWQETEIPILKQTASSITRGLIREFDPMLTMQYDLASIEALKEMQSEMRTWAVSAWNASLIPRDSALELAGLPPIGGEEGKQYKAAPVMKDPKAGLVNPDDPKDDPKDGIGRIGKSKPGKDKDKEKDKEKPGDGPGKGKEESHSHAMTPAQEQLTRRYFKVMSSFFKRQGPALVKHLLAALRNKNGLTVDNEAAAIAVTVGYLGEDLFNEWDIHRKSNPAEASLKRALSTFAWKDWNVSLRRAATDIHKPAFLRAAQDAGRLLGVDISPMDPRLTRFTDKYVAQRVRQLQRTSVSQTARQIRKLFGDRRRSITNVSDEVKQAIGSQYTEWAKWRAARIARSEAAITENHGALLGYTIAGVVGVSVTDGTEHDAECRQANGSTWSLDKAMTEPIEHPNCVRAFRPIKKNRKQGLDAGLSSDYSDDDITTYARFADNISELEDPCMERPIEIEEV